MLFPSHPKASPFLVKRFADLLTPHPMPSPTMPKDLIVLLCCLGLSSECLCQDVRTFRQGSRSVLAEQPIPKKDSGIFYYEMTILEQENSIHIGLGTKQMQLYNPVGRYNGTYAYQSCGRFWGHEVKGCSHDWDECPHIEGKPSFGVRDVIGCGVNLATRQIIYTKNGQRLETAGLCVDYAAELFPCVTLSDSDTKIEANFGPNFKFNIAADGI